jgi:hypothetical protein
MTVYQQGMNLKIKKSFIGHKFNKNELLNEVESSFFKNKSAMTYIIGKY